MENKTLEMGKENRKLSGTFCGHAKGFGFVKVEGMDWDVFVSPEDVHGAFHGDFVEVILKNPDSQPGEGQRPEGEITQVFGHSITYVVGTFQKSKNFGFVKPDNPRITQDIFVPAERAKGAVTGHKVVAELTDYGRPGQKPEGKITEILGHVNDPGTDILALIRAYELPMEFSQRVLNQAERIPLAICPADMAGRRDLRDWTMVTIDGEDAKDLDDAVSISREKDGYLLGVHIADVSNYVQEGSALDREACTRGTSVYLADRVIPMLPHRLSNGICSLNAGEDRLALSCLMKVDQRGRVTEHEIAETVIRVDQRLSYTGVQQVLDGPQEAEKGEYGALVKDILLMEEVAELLRRERQKRGSLDFDFPEAKILLDEQGVPVEIKPYERTTATRIIEDFMLAANETVAADFYWQEQPFLYRTHEAPDLVQMQKLGVFIRNFGYSIHVNGEGIHPKELQKLLNGIEGTPEEAMLSRMTLRSMRQAKYTTDCTGHFGLAARHYCHFTSPIRRYPDLQIHRIIKDVLRGRMNQEKQLHYEKRLPEVAKQSSDTERRAQEAERETEKLKKVQYMEEHLGEHYRGVISGITGYGFYVELPNTVEGLVHVQTLEGEYYEYREATCELVGRDSGRAFKLGQRVNVRVSHTDRMNRTIDFVLCEEENYGQGDDKVDCQ
ncbi:MAG: ribonuclease R [Lachnospiraceae bacterium]|nr:ribonuclease R [Lachnospiraceae bacterium]